MGAVTFGIGLSLSTLAAAPTDNAVASFYDGADGYPAWTDGLKWATVIDMAHYAKGKTNFEKFENARDELAAKGGGVLFYPAGTYDFSEGPFDGANGRGLMLRSGVVIRGESPSGKPNASKDGKLELKTKFVFGFDDRSKVAIDAGTRARFFLSKSLPGKDRKGNNAFDDLYVSLEMKDGKPVGTAPIITRGLDPMAGTVQVDPSGAGVKFTMTLDPTGGGIEQPLTYTVDLARTDKTLKGTFTGKGNETDWAGQGEGRIETVTPKTPRDWNLIGLMPEPGGRIQNVNNVGICWVHLVGASIYFGPDLEWGATWKTAGSWKSAFVKPAWADRKPDGTHPMDPFTGGGKKYVGVGKGRLLFGCAFEQAAQVNNGMNCGVKHPTAPPEAVEGFGIEGFHTHKFGPRISVYGSRVLVANNYMPVSEGMNFKYRQKTIKTGGDGNNIRYGDIRESVLLFDYNKNCGIDVNKDMLGLTRETTSTPDTRGAFFAEGVAVRDNFVYNYGHKGYNIAGRWVSILNNHNARMVLRPELCPYGLGGWRLTLDGFTEVSRGGGGSVSDTLSRAYDLGGQNLWVDGNYYTNTGSSGNDGEGILCQAHGGTHLYSWAVTHNKHDQGIGAAGYMGGWDVIVHGCLIAFNELPGWVGQAMSKDDFDAAYVGNKASHISAAKTSPAIIVPPTGTPSAPKDVNVEPYETDAVKVVWTDTADNEIGFRVQRSLDGSKMWATIAYRPPQVQKNADNPPAWVDFNLPAGKSATYRVVAIGVEDKDDGASAPTAAISLAATIRWRANGRR